MMRQDKPVQRGNRDKLMKPGLVAEEGRKEGTSKPTRAYTVP
jgi:hypothetical protein